ncbi:MAG: bifunctional 3,4-dihydroxy-2-butanone-4-phosphate synthase/GTP cyclohydrolase II [Lautropia sp.]|nr:bifunctional 3,4-dihydroxy-2-butanone-4-phosphate synthase/GTP cyclohydrolase II [Lautropia sp.]
MTSLSSTAEILADFRAGKMVILIDDEDRENEGDIVMAADFVTPEAINFMARHARGLICLTLTEDRCRRLRLPLMTAVNGTKMSTNFTMSIEAAEGVTTGISAADRARTIQAAVAADAKPSDIVQPGHVFPVMARDGGVLMRAGHTEAGCDLGAMTGLTPAAVICEIMKDDGTMARLPDLLVFAREHGLRIGTIADLIAYRSAHETLVERIGQQRVPTVAGELDLMAYRDKSTGQVHLALVVGTPQPDQEACVRVHEPLSALDLLGAPNSHAWPINPALQAIAAHGNGVLLMLNCAPDADVLVGQIRQWNAADDDEAKPESARSNTLRNYGIGAQILRDLGVGRMKLLTRQRRMPSMAGFNLEVTSYQEIGAE